MTRGIDRSGYTPRTLMMLVPVDRAEAYLLEYRPEGAKVKPSELLRLTELVHLHGYSPAGAAEQVQAETTVIDSWYEDQPTVYNQALASLFKPPAT